MSVNAMCVFISVLSLERTVALKNEEVSEQSQKKGTQFHTVREVKSHTDFTKGS